VKERWMMAQLCIASGTSRPMLMAFLDHKPRDKIGGAWAERVKEDAQHIGVAEANKPQEPRMTRAGAGLSASPVDLASCGLSLSRAGVELRNYPSALALHTNNTARPHPVQHLRYGIIRSTLSAHRHLSIPRTWSFLAHRPHGPCVISSPTLFAATRLHGLDSFGPLLHDTAAIIDTSTHTTNQKISSCSLNHQSYRPEVKKKKSVVRGNALSAPSRQFFPRRQHSLRQLVSTPPERVVSN